MNIKIDNKSFQNVVKFKYSGTEVTNKYCIQKEIKIALDSGNADYYLA
jgi:hypothetical protein